MSNIQSKPQRAALSQIMFASAQAVQSVLAGRSLSESLTQTPAELRAATQAVTFHVMRHYGLVNEVKRALVKRTPPHPLFDALLIVALTLLDTALDVAKNPHLVSKVRSLPVYAPHTVVDQAVGAVATRHDMQAYKGLLNGTLRSFSRQRDAILAQARKNPVALYNHPQWWIHQVRRAYPDQWKQLLRAANEPGPMTLRVNRRRSSVHALQEALNEASIPTQAVGNSGLTLEQPRPVHEVPGFTEGWWSVQDAAAQLAAELLKPVTGMRVLDACAAPGGKTAHLLELADLELVALDNDAGRLERIQQNLQRLGLMGQNVTLKCADAELLTEWWDGQLFDAVLADVPCTASGVVRRHPDIRWLRREADLARTATVQRNIINALWKTVKPGGRMLYATCSIFPLEGEQQAVDFMAAHADAVRLPAPGQILPLENDVQRSPYDGFFYALFAKQA